MKALIVTHDASLTGAPILLLSLSKVLKIEGDLEIQLTFIIKNGGPLAQEFRKYGTVIILHNKKDNLVIAFSRRVLRKLLINLSFLWTRKFDFIISNTITNGDLDQLIRFNARVFTYVHELPQTIRACTTPSFLKNVLRHSYRFLAPSHAVINCLKDLGVKHSQISIFPYYIPDYFNFKQTWRNDIRKQLKISDEIVVCGMGSIGWRKGTDIFSMVASMFSESGRNVIFIWCGGNPGEEAFEELKRSSFKSNNFFKVVCYNSEPYKYLAAGDMFFLSSREDPYPLVVIEAASMELPIICFSNSGGAVEFVDNDCGILLRSQDPKYIFQKLKELINDKFLRTKLGKNARKKYLSLHTSNIVQAKFNKIFYERK